MVMVMVMILVLSYYVFLAHKSWGVCTRKSSEVRMDLNLLMIKYCWCKLMIFSETYNNMVEI